MREMDSKNAYIIAASIVVGSCIIAVAVRPPRGPTPSGPGNAPVAAGREAPPPLPARPLAKTPEEKLIGVWQETATWGRLEIAADGTATFTSPPNSIRCHWWTPQEGELRTETEAPKAGAPGVFGDPDRGARLALYNPGG